MQSDSDDEKTDTLKAEEFRKIIKVSPNKFKQLLAEGCLPQPLPLGARCRRWSRQAVTNFLNNPFTANINNNTNI